MMQKFLSNVAKIDSKFVQNVKDKMGSIKIFSQSTQPQMQLQQ